MMGRYFTVTSTSFIEIEGSASEKYYRKAVENLYNRREAGWYIKLAYIFIYFKRLLMQCYSNTWVRISLPEMGFSVFNIKQAINSHVTGVYTIVQFPVQTTS